MTTERERYLLKRCLRLEAEIARLMDIAVIPLPAPPIPKHPRQLQRYATPAEIARMRELKAIGRTLAHIAQMTGFSDSTVSRYTRDILKEREVNG